jgi:hypothetical protein
MKEGPGPEQKLEDDDDGEKWGQLQSSHHRQTAWHCIPITPINLAVVTWIASSSVTTVLYLYHIISIL